jgi:hypothetical protein
MLEFVHDDEQEPVIVPVTVDYEAPFEALMEAGRYRYPDPDLTAANFFAGGKGRRALFFSILEVVGAPLSSLEVAAAIAGRRARGATLLELLAACAAHPELPLDRGPALVHDLAAFGAIRELGNPARRYVPVVQRYNGHRYAEPHPYDFLWRPGDQFLVASLDAAA